MVMPHFVLPSCRLEWPIKIRSRCAAVGQKIRAGDKSAFVAHEQLRYIGNFVGCTGPSGRALGKHIFIKIAAWAVKLVDGQRRYNNAGRNDLAYFFQ